VRLADRAREAPDRRYVLLIDEINRGNLPRIFGELLYVLEYRDDQVALMYSGDGSLFALPRNLWVLGTMNTADRSIGLIDAALRRRFHFMAMFPGRPPLDGLLARWLAAKAPAMSSAATYVDQLNAMLRERFGDHLQVGHSYFMLEDLDESRLERIWELDILPFLEDQLFGKEGELARFQLAAIKRQAQAAELSAVEAMTDADDQSD
jgi:5-methylcytosine-specific restriction protein B